MLSLNTTPTNSNKPGLSKGQVAKRVRSIVISTVVLLVLLVVGGAFYTWYMGQQADVSSAIAEPVAAPTAPTITPRMPAPDAKVGVSVQMITSPLTPGSNASITVRTNAAAKCTISVVYDNVASTDSGLAPKVADDYGMVSWTWTVAEATPLGTWPVKVTCANAKNSGVVATDLKLQKQLEP